jgi:hypothetical protein
MMGKLKLLTLPDEEMFRVEIKPKDTKANWKKTSM